jgi:hypothetical protein
MNCGYLSDLLYLRTQIIAASHMIHQPLKPQDFITIEI